MEIASDTEISSAASQKKFEGNYMEEGGREERDKEGRGQGSKEGRDLYCCALPETWDSLEADTRQI